MEPPEQPGDPVAAYIADWTPDPPAGAGTNADAPGPTGPSGNTWTRPFRLVPLLLAVAALLIVAVVVSRRGSTVNTNDADSVRTSGAGSSSTSSTRPDVVTILATPGTDEPGTTAGTAIPAAPSTVVAPIVASGPRPAAAAPTTTTESTTTTSGPCHPDLAVTGANTAVKDRMGIDLTVENLSDCPATDAVVTIDYQVTLDGAPTLSAGEWHPDDPKLVVGQWIVGPVGAHGSTTGSFFGFHDSTPSHTGSVHVDAVGQSDVDMSNNDVPVECPSSLLARATQHGPVASDHTVVIDIVLRNDGPCEQVITYGLAGGPGGDKVHLPGDGVEHTYSMTVSLSGYAPGFTAHLIFTVTDEVSSTPLGDLFWHGAVDVVNS